MHKVVSVDPIENYCLIVEFENGEKRIADITPLLEKKIFSSLTDVSLFNRVYIDYGAVTWLDGNGNEIDICPDKLYMDSKPLQI